MAEPAKTHVEEAPLYDPRAVELEYRRRQARRRALEQRSRARRNANIRFWFVVVLLLALSVFLSVTIWREIQRLFGL